MELTTPELDASYTAAHGEALDKVECDPEEAAAGEPVPAPAAIVKMDMATASTIRFISFVPGMIKVQGQVKRGRDASTWITSGSPSPSVSEATNVSCSWILIARAYCAFRLAWE